MIAKIIKGSSFVGVLSYILGKGEDHARVLYAEGLRQDASPLEMAKDFALQASLRPNLAKPVCHIILSFSANDAERLEDREMSRLSQDYLQKMGYADTQYLIVRHLDREHPHLHICLNRVDNQGKTISDSNEKYRSTKVCKELTEVNALQWGKGKEAVKRHRLRGNDRLKYEVYDAIRSALPRCTNWQELSSELRRRGIEVQFKTKGQTEQIEGVVFVKDGVSFSGSQVDRSCSYSKLTAQLEQNILALQPEMSLPRQAEGFIESIDEVLNSFTDGLFDTTSPAEDAAELAFQRKLRNQANKKTKRRRL